MACFPTISNDRPIAWQTKTVNATTALAFLALFACAAVAIAVNQSWITSQLSVSQILVIGLAGGGGFGLISVFFKYCCCCGVQTLEVEKKQEAASETENESAKEKQEKKHKKDEGVSLVSPDGGGNIGAKGGANQSDTFKVNQGKHKGFHQPYDH